MSSYCSSEIKMISGSTQQCSIVWSVMTSHSCKSEVCSYLVKSGHQLNTLSYQNSICCIVLSPNPFFCLPRQWYLLTIHIHLPSNPQIYVTRLLLKHKVHLHILVPDAQFLCIQKNTQTIQLSKKKKMVFCYQNCSVLL